MVITLEFVPNEDRISPADTRIIRVDDVGIDGSGDAYTFPELEQMFRNAGFSKSVNCPIPPVVQNVVVSINSESMKKIEFVAQLEKHRNLDATFVRFPFDVFEEFGTKGQVKVKRQSTAPYIAVL